METTKEGTRLDEGDGAHRGAGDALQNASAQVSGTASQLNEKAQKLYADLLGVVRESTVARPFAALAIAAGVGFILGALRAVNRSRPDSARAEWRDRN